MNAERQHADPADLVDERGRAGEERDDEHETPGRVPAAARLDATGKGRGGRAPRLRIATGRDRPDQRREHQVDDAGDADRARKPERVDQDEAAREHADRRAQAVGEVEQRERFARPFRVAAQEAGAHQRERHPERD
jgi:hypothetical protein